MTKLTMDTTTARNKILDEMTMAKSLASNHLIERQAAMKKLRQWMSSDKEDFKEEDWLYLWKGLFYCMWMADKPLVQEELANEISCLIHAPPNYDSSLLFIRTFYLTMVLEWPGIDHHRIDKFMMLVRRFLRQSFELVRKNKWAKEKVDKFSEEIFLILKFLRKGPLGLFTHVKDIYVEELAKVSRGKVPADQLPKLLEPFARFLAVTDNAVLFKTAQKVFSHIIKQSEHGLEHQLKVVSWKRMGFPPNKFNKIKRIRKEDAEDDSDDDLMDDKSDSEIDEGEDEVSQFQDLRAGGDVVVPTIDFNPLLMIDMLDRVKELEETTKKGKGRIQAVIQLFRRLNKGRYPLVTNQIRSVDARRPINVNDEVNKATERLRHIHSLKDAEAVNAYYAMKHKSAPSDDILLAGSGKRKRDWVEKHDYNDSIYLFGQNQVQACAPISNNSKASEGTSKKNTAKKEKTPVKNSTSSPQRSSRGSILKSPPSSPDRVLQVSLEKLTPKALKKLKKAQKGMPKKDFPSTSNKRGKTPVNPALAVVQNETPKSEKRRVEFVLTKNRSQDPKEYRRSLKMNPGIPFSAEKKPTQGVLKASPFPSPVNPFVKRLKRNKRLSF